MASFPGLSQMDHDLVRSYVVAADHLQYSQLPDGIVAILMTHSNLPAKHLDIRLDLHSTIEQVKEKFRTHIGTSVDHQRLILKQSGETLCELSDNKRMLGFYSVSSGMEIHIIDTDPFSLSRGGGLTDTSLISKYTISDEAYDKRKGTMRDYIREQRKVDPNFKLKPNAMAAQLNKKASSEAAAAAATGPPPGAESVEGITVGSRCEVQPGGRRGVVRFVGEAACIKNGGFWVGVKLDEPLGRNDGSYKGERFFDCVDGYGVFARGENIKVGDYPEVDLMDEDDEEGGGDADADDDEI